MKAKKTNPKKRNAPKASRTSRKTQLRAQAYSPSPKPLRQVDNNELSQFFVRYGYVAPNIKITDEVLRRGLVRYQLFHGLPPTGEPDVKYLALIRTPRCGIPEDSGDFAVFEKAKSERKTARYLSMTNAATHAGALPPVRPLKCRWPKSTQTLNCFVDATSSNLNTADIVQACTDAFATWSKAIDQRIVFSEVTSEAAADIVLRWVLNDADGFMAAQDVAHSDFPKRPRCQVVRAYPLPVHFDLGRPWVVRVPPTAGFYDVQTIALHEVGHILGMRHTGETDSIMRETLDPGTQQLALTDNDIDSVRAGYGLPLHFPHQP
ncbi:MAG: matrixin family metalloprotease [Anaerolineae bacterium]|nr:matrixin family metalloprotease [Anaerolineae bacterium]